MGLEVRQEGLFDPAPPGAAGEHFATLLERPGVRVERIVSHGEASPPGFWYDQPHGEWVALLRGRARLRFEDEATARDLMPGDHVDIAPHRRHRVEWTPAGEPTVWLAVFYPAGPATSSTPSARNPTRTPG